MKNLLFIFLLSLGLSATAQIPGKKIDGPIRLSNGLEVKVGDTIKLGAGSNSTTGDFRFIYQPANFLAGSRERQLSKAYTGAAFEVKLFKRNKTAGNIGESIITVIGIKGGFNNAVNLEEAIASGEIVEINSIDVRSQKNGAKGTVGSATDELKKLKELLDERAITQEEYEQMKKKIIN